MKAIVVSGLILSAFFSTAQNVKIQSNKNKTQVKVKTTPAPVTNVQIKNNPGGSQIKIHSNPSGTHIKVKNPPPKGRKK